jgi:uncharacterized alpha/beta hydrolase family protein
MIKRVITIAVGVVIVIWIFSIIISNNAPNEQDTGEYVEVERPRVVIPHGSTGSTEPNNETVETIELYDWK